MKVQLPEQSLFFSKTNVFLNNYLIHQAAKSRYTAKQYRIGLSQFYDYVKDILHMSPISFSFTLCTYAFFLKYMQFLRDVRNLHPATVNARIIAIREYLRYVSNDDASVIPSYMASCRIPTLTVPKEQRPTLSKHDLSTFLNTPKATRIGNRDRFILILLYDLAIRVEELVLITLGDIVITDTTISILIHGKGRKERCVELSARSAEQMKAYLIDYHREPWDLKKPLIYTTIHGEIHPMSIRNVERILNKYGKLARQQSESIPNSVYPHMIRRTRATTLYQDGVPLEQISALLGHSNMETTKSHYAFPSEEQKKAMMNKVTDVEPGVVQEWIGNENAIKHKFGLV